MKGFADKWTHKDLHEAFQQYGDVVSARVSIEEGHKSRGFGYVQFRKPEHASAAVQAVSLFLFWSNSQIQCLQMNGKKYDDLGFELTVSQF